MPPREIVHIRAKDFSTAVYVAAGLREGTRYLVQTENLCPDCTTPMIVLDSIDRSGGAGALRMYHDVDCPVARSLGEETVTVADRSRVAETRRRYLDDEELDGWTDWG